MAPDSRHVTAFVTHEGKFALNVMPFGHRNAAATFQRLMNRLLTAHQNYECAYLDDVAIFSESWEVDVRHVDVILGVLGKAGLRISYEKYQVGRAAIRYLGHVVGSGKAGAILRIRVYGA